MRWLCGPAFLLDRKTLAALILVNGAGTVYGYMWYGNQITYTLEHLPSWLLPFVPDSPTASLLFTLSLCWLYFGSKRRVVRSGRPVSGGAGSNRAADPWAESGAAGAVRGLIDALAVVTSVKYGIWAVIMIVWGWTLGDPVVWEHWMLIFSHLGMAAEALLYARFLAYRLPHLTLAAAWTLANDLVDYRLDVYPWLPPELAAHLPLIERVTWGLSALSIFAASLFVPSRGGIRRPGGPPER